jgi:hypothetical protein
MTDEPFLRVRPEDCNDILDVENPFQTAEETSQMRYTAVTCEPDDFIPSGYRLRRYGEDTELFVAITVCDENEALFSRTMNSYVTESHQ